MGSNVWDGESGAWSVLPQPCLFFLVTCALVGISCCRSRSFREKGTSLVRATDQLYKAKVKPYRLRSGARRCSRGMGLAAL